MVGLVGIEPTTNWLWANCSNPWATGPLILEIEWQKEYITYIDIDFSFSQSNIFFIVFYQKSYTFTLKWYIEGLPLIGYKLLIKQFNIFL